MFDPNAHMPRPNRTLIYMGACMIAGTGLASSMDSVMRTSVWTLTTREPWRGSMWPSSTSTPNI
jgi:hypothetical protein